MLRLLTSETADICPGVFRLKGIAIRGPQSSVARQRDPAMAMLFFLAYLPTVIDINP